MTSLIYSRHWPRIAQGLVFLIALGYAGCVIAVAEWLDDIADPFVRYAVSFVAVQCGILAVLVLALIASKHVRIRFEWLRASRIRKLEEMLIDSRKDGDIVRASRKWPREFLTVVENAVAALKGSAKLRVVELLEASAPYGKLLRQTEDRDPGRAIYAICLLGQLDNADARAAVESGLGHRTEAVRQAARKAILQGSDLAAQRALLDGVARMPAYQRLIMLHFAPADSALLPGFIADALRSGDEERILVALELVLTQQRLFAAAAPDSLARSTSLEVRIRFFRALPFLDLEGDVVKVLQVGLNDADWRVRAMAARACGHFRPAVLVERLLEMCRTSANPPEASHAARALAVMGGEGWLRLQSMAHSDSGLARHIATEAVERHLLGGVA